MALVVAISVAKTESKDRAETIRTLAEMLRALAAWFRRSGSPPALREPPPLSSAATPQGYAGGTSGGASEPESDRYQAL